MKLDGGLLKVIMSKVPFSQDEHWVADCGAAILYLILITSSCFLFFFNIPKESLMSHFTKKSDIRVSLFRASLSIFFTC